MKKRTYSDYVYYAILFTTILLVIIYPIIKNNIEIPKCWILENLKIYCPGCGCTRKDIRINILQFSSNLYSHNNNSICNIAYNKPNNQKRKNKNAI